jgi:threonine dehydratase
VDLPEQIRGAEQRIRPHIRETILESSLPLSRAGGADVFSKLENLQHTGSFKARGAMNKLLSLKDEELGRGAVAASTGNHGAAVARSLQVLGASGIVFVTEGADASKIAAIERMGVEIRRQGGDCIETEAIARQYARENRMTYVSPYNDPDVIAGQGTIGVELARQLDRIDAVFVALGGGGLIAGIAAYLKSVHPGVKILGCSPENSRVMIDSVRAGGILDLPSLPTLSDGTAGGVEAGSITFDLCRELVDDYVTVTEEEIADSLRFFIESHHLLIEGAAAVAVGSYLKTRQQYAGQNVVIIICGGNISLETLKKVL